MEAAVMMMTEAAEASERIEVEVAVGRRAATATATATTTGASRKAFFAITIVDLSLVTFFKRVF